MQGVMQFGTIPLFFIMSDTFEIKLQAVFLQLFSNSSIKDDTILQKLQTCVTLLIESKDNQIVWSNNVGLLTFIEKVFDQNFISNEENQAIGVFALHCLAALFLKEENVDFLIQHKIFQHFITALPKIQESFSLSSASLDVASSMIEHPSGVAVAKEKGIWECILLPCLKSQSIFVQKKCVTVITSLLLKSDPKDFSNYIYDLELILYKVREARHGLMLSLDDYNLDDPHRKSMETSINVLHFNINTVLLVFYDLLQQTLGVKCIYSQLKSTLDLTSKILFRFNFEMSSALVIKLCRMLFLSTLHRFQDQVITLGTAEQFHLESITSDLLSLCQHMISKGRIKEFILASFDLHIYWNTMCKNMKSEIELSKCQSILFVILRFQKIPLQVVCHSSFEFADEIERRKIKESVSKWDEDTFSKMSIKDDQKEEVRRLEGVITEQLSKDLKEAGLLCTSCLSSCSSIVKNLHSSCAVSLFQGIMILLRFQFKICHKICYSPKLYQMAIDALRSLIIQFDMDWTKCYEVNSILTVLCSVVWVPGLNTRVKVTTLKTISVCIERFLPPVMATLVNSDKVDDANIDKLGQTLSIYLADTEWEVRDSALELLVLCMKLSKEKYPYFEDWFIRHKLFDIVIQAVGDVEPYVQASSLEVISCLVGIESNWPQLQARGIKQVALRAVSHSGDTCICKAGLGLISSLFLHSKFDDNELKMMVLPVVQNAAVHPDDEVRLCAVHFIKQHLEKELTDIGMVDGEFPPVTFHHRKIIKLQPTEVSQRVLGVLRSACADGYVSCLIECSKDSATSVSKEAINQIMYLHSIIKQYNLHSDVEKFLDSLRNGKPGLEPSSRLSNSTPELQTNDEDMNRGIDFVVEASDIDIISKRKSISTSFTPSKWHSGEPINVDELPAPFPALSSQDLFKELEIIAGHKKEPMKDACHLLETEVNNLLDDIQLHSSSADCPPHAESRSLDCY